MHNMRKEPFGVGSFVHVVKRGARGLPFVRDQADKHHLLVQMRHLNEASVPINWLHDLASLNMYKTFERPDSWQPQKKLTHIHSFCLHDNHMHLLLEEIEEGGVSMFMHKFGTAASNHLNEKYKETGSPFQGAYRSKTVDSDPYLRYVFAYIEVKNTFEQYPRGYRSAERNFADAFAWARTFAHASLSDHIRESDSLIRGIVETSLFDSLWTARQFEAFSADVIAGRTHLIEPAQEDSLSGFFQ
jgi:REP element-mobilizing transposase RayT